MNPGIRILPISSVYAFSEGGWTGRGHGIIFSWDGKLSLKADESQVGQLHGGMGRKRKYYHIIIFQIYR